MSAKVTTGTAARITHFHPKAILYWIKRGWIKAERNSQAGQSWWLMDSADARRVAAERRK